MYSKLNLLLAGFICLISVSHAQYGVLENFEGGDRNGFGTNAYEGATFQFSGGSPIAYVEADGIGINGSRGLSLIGNQGDFAGIVAKTGAAVDVTGTTNGLTCTGYSIWIRDNNPPTDFTFRAETNSNGNDSETFTISTTVPSSGTYVQYAFNRGSGVVSGAFDETSIDGIVLIPTTTGPFDFDVDDIAFEGNIIPTTGDIDDFDSYAAGAFTGSFGPNTNGGSGFTFSFTGGTIDTEEIVDLGGGDNAAHIVYGGVVANAGFVLDCGPHPGAQIDVQNFNGVRFDIAMDDPDDTIDILIETQDAANFGDRCVVTLSPTTTLTSQDVTFVGLTCGGQGFTTDSVSKINFTNAVDVSGNGTVGFTINNFRFVNDAVFTPPTGPEIDLTFGAVNVNTGSNFDMGAVFTDDPAPTLSYIVTNNGDFDLISTGTIVDGPFVVTDALVSPLASGATDTVTVELPTTAEGNFAGVLQIFSDDSNENPFVINLTGQVADETLNLFCAEFDSGTTDSLNGVPIREVFAGSSDADPAGILAAGLNITTGGQGNLGEALELNFSLTNASFFGIAYKNLDDSPISSAITATSILSFDARLGGTSGAFNEWAVRVEDASEFGPNFVSLSLNLNTSYQNFSIPIQNFATFNSDYSGAGTVVVTPENLNAITFFSEGAPVSSILPANVDCDLQIDNIKIVKTKPSLIDTNLTTDVSVWEMYQ